MEYKNERTLSQCICDEIKSQMDQRMDNLFYRHEQKYHKKEQDDTTDQHTIGYQTIKHNDTMWDCGATEERVAVPIGWEIVPGSNLPIRRKKRIDMECRYWNDPSGCTLTGTRRVGEEHLSCKCQHFSAWS